MALNLSQLSPLSNQQHFVAFFDPEPFFLFVCSERPIPEEAEASFCPVRATRGLKSSRYSKASSPPGIIPKSAEKDGA